MGKVRILHNTDGTVTVVYPAPKSKLTEIQALDKATPKGVEYDDVDVSEIPSDRSKRYAWKSSKGNGISVDETIEDPEKEKKDKNKSAKNKLKELGLTQAEVDSL